MFQKFNVDTLVGRFIQSLMYNTYIPLYKSVWEGDFVVEGCFYIYHKNVVKCTKTGVIGDEASFDYIEFVDLSNPNYTFMSNLFSSNNYYDTDVHEQLGNYLRYLKYNENLDLMPFYNCFSSNYTSNFSITNHKYREGINNSKQVILVPIQYNRVYTIALDCKSAVEILPVVLADRKPLETVVNGELINLNNLLTPFYEYRVKTSFSKPFTFELNLTDSTLYFYRKTLELNQKGLYLVIQLPIDNVSSIVVLEGDYTNNGVNRHFDIMHVDEMSQKDIDSAFISDLSLLRINDNNIYAFSDRLLEHLFLNAINNTETIDNNIETIQRLLGMNTYGPTIQRGVWTDEIRYKAFNSYKEGRHIDYRFEMIDINGFIDKDIEQYLIKGASNA